MNEFSLPLHIPLSSNKIFSPMPCIAIIPQYILYLIACISFIDIHIQLVPLFSFTLLMPAYLTFSDKYPVVVPDRWKSKKEEEYYTIKRGRQKLDLNSLGQRSQQNVATSHATGWIPLNLKLVACTIRSDGENSFFA